VHNYHSPYVDQNTRYVAVDLNPPLSGLDKALTYLKNVMVGCDGVVTYDSSTGKLTWTGVIHIYFNREDGLATHNSIAAGDITLSDGSFAYVTLSEVNNAVLAVASATLSPGAASNFLAYNILVLGFRNTADDMFYGSLWPLVLRSVYIERALLGAGSVVGRRSSGGIVAISFSDLKTDLALSSSDSPEFTGVGVAGTTGGYIRKRAEATADITASASVAITLSIPSGARLLGVQFRVDAALATGELWDAAYSGGSTTSLASASAVAQNTKVNRMHAAEISTDTVNIAITKSGGGSFTAQGTIRAIAYYETFDAMADA